jgi:uncharacterized membrane protein YhaH (DUF805 family)
MQRLRQLLRFDGRLSRLGYWRSYLWLAVAGVLATGVGLFAILGFGRWGAIFLLPAVAMIVASVAIVVRRLHDRNRSGWWLLVLVLFPALAGLWIRTDGSNRAATWPVFALSLAGLIANIWGLIEIGFRRGTRGSNRFGDEPAVGS